MNQMLMIKLDIIHMYAWWPLYVYLDSPQMHYVFLSIIRMYFFSQQPAA